MAEIVKTVAIDINDLVFENRNKKYGAYDIRRSYPKHVRNALIAAIAALLLILFIPQILSLFKSEKVEAPPVITTVTSLKDAPSMEHKPPPPMIKVEVPKTIQFVAPKITKEETTTKEILNQKVETPIAPVTTEGTGTVELPKEEVKVIETPKEPEFYEFADVDAEPPGGYANLRKYLHDHIQYPQMAIDNNIQGTVSVRVIIGVDGAVQKAEVIKGISGGCDEEALRVIKGMPKWKPAEMNHKPVPFRLIVPVKFELQ